jgi:integrase/recombinase XerD
MLTSLAAVDEPVMSQWAADVARWTAFLTATGMADMTIRAYRRTLVCFIADTLLEPNDATEDDLVAYLAELPAKGHTRPMVTRTLRSYYGWAAPRVQRNPAERLRARLPKYGPAGALTEDEMVRVVLAAAQHEQRRAWAILLMYATGIRLTSAVSIRPEDVRGDMLYIRVAKGDRPYAVPLGPIGFAAVCGLMETAGEHLIGVQQGRLWDWIHQAGLDSGLRVYPHLLRHTWATRQIENNTNPRVVQELGNWADLSQLGRYAHVGDEQKRAAAL